MIEIILDLYGGDLPAEKIAYGAAQALTVRDDISLTLVGEKSSLFRAFEGCDKSRLRIIESGNVLTNKDNSVLALRDGADYTISLAFDRLKEVSGRACLISVGSTGAVLLSSLYKVGLLEGCTKPALASILYTFDGQPLCMLDCGANLEVSDDDLVRFAFLGADAMKAFYSRPKVACLSVGKEAKKGTPVMQSAYNKLAASQLDFVGNVEPEDVFAGGACHVLVTNGLAGNILLKNTENAVLTASKIILESVSEFGGDVYDKASAAYSRLRSLFSYNEFGGAFVLGINKTVMKAHGKATASTIRHCILQGCRLSEK